jgi:hypothetical protein
MSSNILEELEKYKQSYYSENKKNLIFKKDQKMEVASKIATEFNVDELLRKTVFIIPGTNKMYVDYLVFKLYAHPTNYVRFVEYTQSLIPDCIRKYGTFECHVNLSTFTVSAAERYKEIVEIFNVIGLRNDTDYSIQLTNLYVYNTPSSIDHISKIIFRLIEPELRDKIVLYSKAESVLLNPLPK